MKRLIQIGLLTALIFLISGCQGNQPTAGKIDKRIPTLSGIKHMSDITEIAFEWAPIRSANIRGYYIYRYDNKNKRYLRAGSADSRFSSHFVDTKLNAGTTYRYKFSAYTDSFESMPSKIVIAKTKGAVAKMPFVKSVLNLPGIIKLIWRPHPNRLVNGYIVERREAVKRSSWSELEVIEGRLNAEYMDKDLSANSKYLYRVKAKTYNGLTSAPSEVVIGTTKPKPHLIQNLNATTDLPTAVILTWSANLQKDFAYYKVYRRGGFEGLIGKKRLITNTNKISYTDETLKPGENAEYIVTAVNKMGMESDPQKKAVLGSLLGRVSPPKILKDKSKITTEAAIIVWKKSGDLRVKSYTIIKKAERKTLQVTRFSKITDNYYRDTEVESGVKYAYRVVAIDENGIESGVSSALYLRIAIGEE